MTTKIVDVRKGAGANGAEISFTKVFNLQYTDERTGAVLAGDFTVKRLTVGDVGKIAIRKAQLNGGQAEDAIDVNTRWLHQMIAHLEYAITDAPKWWKPLDFYDAEPVEQLYEKVVEFELSFRRPVPAQSPGIETNSQSTVGPSETHAPKVVGGEVSPPANV